MATQTVEFSAPSGQTVTAKLFSPGSDTQVDSASATEETNRTGVYSVDYVDVAAGLYRLIAVNSGGTLLAQWWVDLTLTTATFQSYEMPVSVMQSGLSTFDAGSDAVTVGAMDANTLTASAIAADAITEIQSGLSTLDAAGVRTAVGLASANLDTQLADIPTVTEFEARTLVAASYFDPAVDSVTVGAMNANTVTASALATDAVTEIQNGLSTLDAAGVRSAVGMASANLDTQLADLPTVTEFNARTLASASYFDPSADGVIVTINNDKSGYSLSAAGNTAVVNSLFARTPTKASQHTVERIFWNNDRTSIVDDGEVVANVANTAQSFETTLTGMADKYNDSLIQFTSGALEGESNSIASMDAAGVITFHDAFTAIPSGADEFIVRPESSHSPEEIAAAVEELLSTVTRSELAGAPAANAPIADKLTWLAMLSRNRIESTSSAQTLYADDEATVVSTASLSDNGTTSVRGEAT